MNKARYTRQGYRGDLNEGGRGISSRDYFASGEKSSFNSEDMNARYNDSNGYTLQFGNQAFMINGADRAFMNNRIRTAKEALDSFDNDGNYQHHHMKGERSNDSRKYLNNEQFTPYGADMNFTSGSAEENGGRFRFGDVYDDEKVSSKHTRGKTFR